MRNPNYNESKIYKIISEYTDEIYIGSTTIDLNKRLSIHKNDYIRWEKNKFHYINSFQLIQYGDGYKIELLESYPCNNNKELTDRENYWINQFRSIAVNKK